MVLAKGFEQQTYWVTGCNMNKTSIEEKKDSGYWEVDVYFEKDDLASGMILYRYEISLVMSNDYWSTKKVIFEEEGLYDEDQFREEMLGYIEEANVLCRHRNIRDFNKSMYSIASNKETKEFLGLNIDGQVWDTLEEYQKNNLK